MDRADAARVGTEVSKAIVSAGKSPAAVAEAIGLDQPEMDACLAGVQEFSVSQLVEVGGLLRVRASSLLLGRVA